MNLITLDFETYYAADYTLSRMTTEEYIRDPRFETIMVGVKINNDKPMVFIGDHVPLALRALDIPNSILCCHHAQFDGLILSHHYGITPKIWLDTIPMARAEVGSVAARGMSLATLAEYYGLQAKGDEVLDAKGKHLADFTPYELKQYAKYCANDVELTKSICDKLLPRFTKNELKLIDITTRLFTEPILEFDTPLLEYYKQQVVANKAFLLMRSGVEREDMTSNNKFAEILKARGITPGMKNSKTAVNPDGTPKRTYAFAKTDPFMKSLLEHDDELISSLAEARLGVKTSIAETRAQRYIDMGSRGPACIYLQYWGAEQTGRHSARDKTNFLNMGRSKELLDHHKTITAHLMTPLGRTQITGISDDRKKAITPLGEFAFKDCHQVGLRDSLRAPKGYSIVVGDSANIEARKLVFLAGQQDMVEAYREGRDVYCEFGSDLFGRAITKADIPERQLSKVACLGLGFGMGVPKFVDTVKAWDFGSSAEMMKPIQADIEMLRKAVALFRGKYEKVVDWWDYLNKEVISALAEKRRIYCDPQGLISTTERGTVLLPSGRELRYPNLRQELNKDSGWNEWVFDVREGRRLLPSKLYGGRLAENLTQAMARVVVMDQIVQISKRYRIVLPVYDEAVACVPDDQAEECEKYIALCLSTPPVWAPALPVGAETGISKFYGGAKG